MSAHHISTLGIAYKDVLVPGQVGPLPAWFVAGQRTTWVLMVHGYNGTREQGLCILPLVTGLGFPVLNISYRNDPGAPASPDHLYHLGDTDWQDVEAGVRYALDHGALVWSCTAGQWVAAWLKPSSNVRHTRPIYEPSSLTRPSSVGMRLRSG